MLFRSGTPYRSYLYAADLTEWLFTILLRGQSGRAYNVGSEEAVSIRELAERVAETLGLDVASGNTVEVTKQTPAAARGARYVPSSRRASNELRLSAATPIAEAIFRTAHFARTCQRIAPRE